LRGWRGIGKYQGMGNCKGRSLAPPMAKYDRPGTLFYLDPPYWQTEGYGVPFGFDNYLQLAEIMRTIKGKAILSINDHPEIREAFHGLPFSLVGTNYIVGGPGKGARRQEMIIRSWRD